MVSHCLTPRANAVAVRGRRVDAAERALADQCHQVVAREHHGERIAVSRRQIGEVFDVAAHVIVVVLHQQHVDLVRVPWRRARRAQRRSSSAVEIGVCRRGESCSIVVSFNSEGSERADRI